MPPVLNFIEDPKARAVAVVRGEGDRNGDLLYLHMDGTPQNTGAEIYGCKYAKEMRVLKPSDRIRIMNLMLEGVQKGLPSESIVGLPESMKPLYARMISDHGKEGKRIVLPPGSTFEPLPSSSPEERQIWYVAGQSGSGKSWFARSIAQNYAKLYPERKIYLVSKLEEDETLDTMKIGKPIRIPVQSLVDTPFDLQEAKDSLVIVDDWDTLEESKQKPYLSTVRKFIEDICTMGRHCHTSLVIISHKLSDYSKTRLMLNESHFLVLYPQSVSPKAFQYTLENYGGLDKSQIKPLRSLGRWVMVHKCYPSFVLSANEAYLTHDT